MDKFNASTKSWSCRLLEWSGWYNGSIALRLLGHYRLFQVFKKKTRKMQRLIPLTQAYILQYHSGHGIKYFISRVVSLIYSTFTFGEPYPFVEIETFNNILINEHFSVLEEFLINAETDFTAAFHHAMLQINQKGFMDRSQTKGPTYSPTLVVQVQQEIKNTQNNAYTHNEIHLQTAITAGPKGKESGVLSKWQILVFFDLLNQSAGLEKIDLSKPNKFDGYAAFLHALTGKSQQSWINELKDCQGKDLYQYHSPGQLDEIINSLTNVATFLRAAGFRSLVSLADKKIIELNQKKNKLDNS